MRILLIDDDQFSLESLEKFLINPLGHRVTTVNNCEEALVLFKEEPFPIIISDIKMPGMGGLELLQKIKLTSAGQQCDMVMMTGFGDLNSSIEAMRAGASDYLLKPVSVKQLDLVISRIIENRKLREEYSQLKEKFDDKLAESTSSIQTKLSRLESIYSELMDDQQIGFFSDSMQKIVELCRKLYEQPHIPVLIEGETGTGKEVIARLIHSNGETSSAPFISLNCSAISSSLFESELFGYEEGAFTGAKRKGALGKLELAQGGTIFLDEIGDMPLDLQPKLLRVIQQKEIYKVGGQKPVKLNVRFICATNQSLQEMVNTGRFRSDLFYRLNTGYVLIPPLRERKTEIAPLARLFLQDTSKRSHKLFQTITRDAIYLLEDYNWPGNIRELKSVIERVVLLYDDVSLKKEYLSFLIWAAEAEKKTENEINFKLTPDGLPLKEIEFQIATKVLELCEGNITNSAKYLNIAWATFVRMARLKK